MMPSDIHPENETVVATRVVPDSPLQSPSAVWRVIRSAGIVAVAFSLFINYASAKVELEIH